VLGVVVGLVEGSSTSSPYSRQSEQTRIFVPSITARFSGASFPHISQGMWTKYATRG
jgi:hypothetical protein